MSSKKRSSGTGTVCSPVARPRCSPAIPAAARARCPAAVAALYSTGAPFPGSTEQRTPQRVLICAAEDGAADTKRPRLAAAGADLSKVAFLDLVQHGARQRYFTLADIPALDVLLTKYPGEFGLLVVDPIGSYLAGKDSHRDSDVRELLRPLGVLAEQHRIAVLLIAHLNKVQRADRDEPGYRCEGLRGCSTVRVAGGERSAGPGHRAGGAAEDQRHRAAGRSVLSHRQGSAAERCRSLEDRVERSAGEADRRRAAAAAGCRRRCTRGTPAAGRSSGCSSGSL